MKTVVIGANDAGQRLDKFLTKSFPNLPQSMLYKSIRKKDIKLNGKRCGISDRLAENDVLSMYLKDEFFQTQPKQYDFLKAPARLNVAYEDDNLLVLDKQPGLIVHPDESYHFDSLIARVQHYLFDKGEYRPDEENSFAPALINRIDRNTGGLVMAAKNAETLRIMNEKVKQRELQKLYLCVVCGVPQKRSHAGRIPAKKRNAKPCLYFRKTDSGYQNDQNPVSGFIGAERIQPAGGGIADRTHAPDQSSSCFHRSSAGRRREIRNQRPQQSVGISLSGPLFL